VPRHDQVGIAYALLAAACFGLSVAIAKILLGELSWTQMVLGRFLIASAVCWAIVAITGTSARLTREQGRRIVAAGVLVAWGALAGTFALQSVPAWLVVAVLYAYPALVAQWSNRTGVPLRGRWARIALGLAFGGVLLSVAPGGSTASLFGVVVAATTPVAYAALYATQGLIAGETAGRTGLSRAGAQIAPIAYGGYVCVTALAVATPVCLFVGIGSFTPGAPSVLLAGYAVIAAAAPLPLAYAAVRNLGAARVALLSTSEVLAAIISSVAILGQVPTIIQVIGCAMIIGSALLIAGGFRVDSLAESPYTS
jgi:drug/metabolite transporter (DMT)-like permease